MNKVSLIIPVYNTEKYLRKCIESAIGQTYRNMEIICIDDGSTDSSGQILDEYAQKDKRLVVLHQANRGESAARNVGLQMATGEYIGFMDCDDWIEPEMYETLVSKLEEEDADIAVCGWFLDRDNCSQRVKNAKEVEQDTFGREKLLEYVYERDSYRAFAYMWDKLYKRELFVDREGEPVLFDETLKLGGDVLVLGRLILKAECAVYIDQPFYHYLQRDDSGCHSRDVEKRKDWLKAYEILIEIFEKEAVNECVMGLVKRFLAYHSSNVAELSFEQKRREDLLYCQNLMKQYEQEYCRLNVHYPEYIQRFKEIMEYSI